MTREGFLAWFVQPWWRMSGPNGEPRPLAPKWHTAGLIAIVIATAAAGALLQKSSGPGPGIVAEHRGVIGIYITAILMDGALFYYVWVFCHKTEPRFASSSADGGAARETSSSTSQSPFRSG